MCLSTRNKIVGVGWKHVGGWHFEESRDGTSRGFPVDATLDSGGISPGGVIGNCLDLSDGVSAGVTIPAFPSLNSVAGISLELYVCFPVPAERTLIAKGDYYAIDVDEEGVLQGRLKLVPAAAAGKVTPELYQIVADNHRIPTGRWVKIAFHFNGYSTVLTVNGIIVAEEEFKDRKRLLTSQVVPIRVGNIRAPFAGLLDEVRIGIAVTGDEMTLPETVRIEKAPRRIYFDREGFLDRHHHTAPVDFALAFGEGRRSLVTIGLFGEVRAP